MASTSNSQRNKYGKRKPRRAKKTKLTNTIAKVVKEEMEKKEQQEVELKCFDTDIVPASVTSVGSIYQLTNIPLGTSFQTRIGSSVTVKNLLVRYELVHNDPNQIMRLILLRWFDNTVPTVADILESLSTYGSPWPISPLKRDNAHKIKVLYDNLFALSTYTNANIVDKVFYEKNMNVSWTDASGVNNGHLYLLCISDSINVGHPTLAFSSRVRYTDA